MSERNLSGRIHRHIFRLRLELLLYYATRHEARDAVLLALALALLWILRRTK